MALRSDPAHEPFRLLTTLAASILRGHPSKRTGLIHAAFNVVALVLFAVALAMYLPKWNTGSPSATEGISLAAVGVFPTIMAGFQGWTLVQDHHIGVKMERRATQ